MWGLDWITGCLGWIGSARTKCGWATAITTSNCWTSCATASLSLIPSYNCHHKEIFSICANMISPRSLISWKGRSKHQDSHQKETASWKTRSWRPSRPWAILLQSWSDSRRRRTPVERRRATPFHLETSSERAPSRPTLRTRQLASTSALSTTVSADPSRTVRKRTKDSTVARPKTRGTQGVTRRPTSQNSRSCSTTKTEFKMRMADP